MSEFAIPEQEVGNDVSQMLYETSKQTWLAPEGQLGHVQEYGTGFTSFRAMPLDAIGRPDLLLSQNADGVGTKIEVAERLEDHRTIAHDLIAMSCDDAVVRGARPFSVATVLDFSKIDKTPKTKALMAQLAQGYAEAARLAGVTVINGEAAELGDRVDGYGDFNYNWSSTALWIANRNKIIDDRQIQPRDSIVAFLNTGLGSNGCTKARSIGRLFGPEWHEYEIKPAPSAPARKLGELMLTPSPISTPVMNDLTGDIVSNEEPKAQINGAAHITGGGIPEKLGRILQNTGHGAYIEDAFEPPYVAQFLQSEAYRLGEGEMSDEDAYRQWNMGHCMMLVTPEPAAVIKTAEAHGVSAKEIGAISSKPGIRIVSKGVNQRGKVLAYNT